MIKKCSFLLDILLPHKNTACILLRPFVTCSSASNTENPHHNVSSFVSQAELNVETKQFPLIVKNLPKSITWQDMEDLMKNVGTVSSVHMLHNENETVGNSCKVYFNDLESSLKALNIYGNVTIEGRKLLIEVNTMEKTKIKAANNQETTSSPIVVDNQVHGGLQHSPSNVGTESLCSDDTNVIRSSHEKEEARDMRLYFDHVPLTVTWLELEDFVTDTLGYSVSKVLLRAAPSGTTQQAMVQFETSADARYACRKLQGLVMRDSVLSVRLRKTIER